MKINGVNSDLSFRRAVKINSDANCLCGYKKHKVDNNTQEILNAIKGNKNSKEYSAKEYNNIGLFLRNIFDDYSDKTGMYVTTINCDIYAYTGFDAIKAREINRKAKKEYENFEQKCKNGPTEDMDTDEKLIYSDKSLMKMEKENIGIRRRKALVELANNNTGDKKDIRVDFHITHSDKIDQIAYEYLDETGMQPVCIREVYDIEV